MQRLRFLHIPKTAGSTFSRIIIHQYNRKLFSFTDDIDSDINRFQMLSEDDKNNIVLFIGHAPIVTSLKEADDAMIITILRDPIKRVKSFCRHVASGESPYLREAFPPESFSLDRFLESGNEELFNLQTRMLINNKWASDLLLLKSMSASEAKDAALENLFNKVSYFGLQEYFDESLTLFWSSLNWPKMPSYAPLRQSVLNMEFKRHHLERIEELNAIDIEVYKAAKERFLKIINSEAFDKAKLKRFRIANALISPAIKIWRQLNT